MNRVDYLVIELYICSSFNIFVMIQFDFIVYLIMKSLFLGLIFYIWLSFLSIQFMLSEQYKQSFDNMW